MAKAHIIARGSITREKIDASLLFKGKKGTYLDLAFFENSDGPDQYGNDGFIAQGVSKEQRESGLQGPILGNWKYVATRPATQPEANADAPSDETASEFGDLPF